MCKENAYIIEGNEDCIKKILRLIKRNDLNNGIKIQKLDDRECDIISDLTKNQKKILHYARKYGYYDYPRKITSEELSKKTGIDKDEILESLRKTEKHIVNKILEDNFYLN